MGTSGEVAEQIERYRRTFGDRLLLILRLNYPGMDSAEVKKAITRLGAIASQLGAGA